MGPDFYELIYILLCSQLHMTTIDFFCVPFVPIADVPHDAIEFLQTFLPISFKQAVFSHYDVAILTGMYDQNLVQ